MLLAGGRAWLDFGDSITVYSPDGSEEEIEPEGEYLGIVADRKGGVQLIRQEGDGLRITPIEGGEGFLTENGVLGCGDGSGFLYLAAADGLYTISDSGKARLLIDFAACKMEFFSLSAVSPLDDKRFMCTTQSGEAAPARHALRAAGQDGAEGRRVQRPRGEGAGSAVQRAEPGL